MLAATDDLSPRIIDELVLMRTNQLGREGDRFHEQIYKKQVSRLMPYAGENTPAATSRHIRVDSTTGVISASSNTNDKTLSKQVCKSCIRSGCIGWLYLDA